MLFALCFKFPIYDHRLKIVWPAKIDCHVSSFEVGNEPRLLLKSKRPLIVDEYTTRERRSSNEVPEESNV